MNLIGWISRLFLFKSKIFLKLKILFDIMSSPVHPMDLDENGDYYPSSSTTYPTDHHTPLTKMLFTQDYHFHQTPTLFRIVHNPFDPPTSAHLKQRLASPSIFRVLSQTDDNDQVIKRENENILGVSISTKQNRDFRRVR